MRDDLLGEDDGPEGEEEEGFGEIMITQVRNTMVLKHKWPNYIVRLGDIIGYLLFIDFFLNRQPKKSSWYLKSFLMTQS